MKTRRWSAAVLALSLGLGACVTTIVEGEASELDAVDLTPVVIPLGEQGDTGAVGPVGQYYESVILQMQEALAEAGEPPPEGGSPADRIRGAWMRLQSLLATHDRAGAPEWAQARFGHFHAAAAGLELELHLVESSRVELAHGAVPIGAPLEFALRAPGLPGREIELGRNGTRLSFLATVTLADHDALGGTTKHRQSHILRPEGAVLDAEHPLELPFGAVLEAGNTAIREVVVEVELLPGVVGIEGIDAPVHRVLLARQRDLTYPRGVGVIRAKPLATLRAAVRLGDERYFRHQFLAAHFMPEPEQRPAAEALIGQVRLGTALQARAAMASLREMTGAAVPVGDRDAWLRWWQQRRSPPR